MDSPWPPVLALSRSSKKHQKRPGSHGVSAKTTLEEGSSITSAGNTTVIPSGQSAEEHVDLRLLVVHFSVGTVSVGLNSRGNAIICKRTPSVLSRCLLISWNIYLI